MKDEKNLGFVRLFLKKSFSKKDRHIRRIHKVSRFDLRKNKR